MLKLIDHVLVDQRKRVTNIARRELLSRYTEVYVPPFPKTLCTRSTPCAAIRWKLFNVCSLLKKNPSKHAEQLENLHNCLGVQI
jgi:hypothetical protein